MSAPMKKVCCGQLLRKYIHQTRRLCTKSSLEEWLKKLPSLKADEIEQKPEEQSKPEILPEEHRPSEQAPVINTDAGIAADLQHTEQLKRLRASFRTEKTDTNDHTTVDEAKFYQATPEVYKSCIKSGQDPNYRKQVKTFQEACVMVRRPALDIMALLKNVNFDLPPLRVVVYGAHGNGKTMTMAHVIQHCWSHDWIVCHIPYVGFWMKWFKEWNFSNFKPERVDLPLMATQWLTLFKEQNARHLGDMVTTQDYKWSNKERSEQGTSLMTIVNFGLERNRYSNDCIGIVLKELRLAASNKQRKVLVVIDGVNGFFGDTHIRHEMRTIPASELSLVHNFKKMLQPTWTNGFVLCSVDVTSNLRERNEDYRPLYLLQEEGFNFLDPFIPIHVDKYSDRELDSCISYYIDRLWISSEYGKSAAGRKELTFLCNKNPLQLMKICASW